MQLNVCVCVQPLAFQAYDTLSTIIYPSKQCVSSLQWVTAPLMLTFQETSVVCFPNAWCHVTVEVFKGNFWVIVMSSRRQRHRGCSLHGAQLSTGTCRSRPWLYRVALSDSMHRVPPCLLSYVLSYNERALAMALYILKKLAYFWIVVFFFFLALRFGLIPEWFCQHTNLITDL